jgi:Protein of unknown function (DUF2971)
VLLQLTAASRPHLNSRRYARGVAMVDVLPSGTLPSSLVPAPLDETPDRRLSHPGYEEPVEAISQAFETWHALMKEEARWGQTKDVYHYTNAAGALGILSGRNLWATHYQYMNDPSEAKVALPLMREIAREAHAVCNDPRDADALPLIDQVKCLLANSLLENLDDMHSVHAPMVVSFSSDFNSLPQWRLYGDRGRGYAVGFSTEAFASKLGPETAGVYFGPVVYSTTRHRKLIRRIFETAAEHARDHIVAQPDLDVVAADWPKWTGALLHMLILTSPFLKHRAYAHEREWRLVTETLQPGVAIRSLNGSPTGAIEAYDSDPAEFKEQMRARVRQYKLRVQRGTLVPYVEVGLDQFGPGVLSDIMAGPCIDREREISTGLLELLLQSGNWKGRFSPGFSKLPYSDR